MLHASSHACSTAEAHALRKACCGSIPQTAGFSDVAGMLNAMFDRAALVRAEYVFAEALREGLVSSDSALILCHHHESE